MQSDHAMSGTEWALLLALSVLWGGAFFFAKVAIAGLPPLTIVFLRFACAAALVYALLRATRRPVPRSPAVWAAFFVMGLFNNLVPAGLITWGQTMIPSGLASVLIATTPIASILATRVLGGGPALTPGKVAGMLLGVGGTAILFHTPAAPGASAATPGILACLAAAASYGLANAFGRRFQRLGIPPITGAFGQMAASSAMTLPCMLLLDHPWRLPPPGMDVWAAMAGLVVLSTALAYILFFRILATAGAVNVSLVTLLIPISALLLGCAVLGETLYPTQLAGILLIALGLLTIDGRLSPTIKPPR